jgi:hypothetical protein
MKLVNVFGAGLSALLAVTAVAGAVASDTPSDISSFYRAKMEELGRDGVEKIAPQEVEAARSFFESCTAQKQQGGALAERYEELVRLQVGLMERMVKASGAQLEAQQAEKAAYEARMEMEVEKAAYEFFVDQMLASGLVSQWAVP